MTQTLQIESPPQTRAFREDVIEGLSDHPKRLPCKYFYDKRGSALFDQICDLDEYYLTRTEQSIMNRYAHEMGHEIGTEVMLIEYGSGSSIKTRVLLKNLTDASAYVPVDISHRHLHQVAEGLRCEFPHIEILPVTADFTGDVELPEPKKPVTHAAVYFPGSTIGNFEPAAAERLLQSIAHQCGRGGGLLIGIDLVKDTRILERAYDDASGVTAQFNLNLLHRLRDELDAEIDPAAFEHHSFFNEIDARIEIYLRSLEAQSARIGEMTFHFDEGELVHTEFSHKYTIESFERLAARAGLQLNRCWTDDDHLFAVLHLIVEEGSA